MADQDMILMPRAMFDQMKNVIIALCVPNDIKQLIGALDSCKPFVPPVEKAENIDISQ